MRELFLDTDIILDFLGNRKPYSGYASRIFAGTHTGQFRIHTSANSVTTTYYLLEKTVDDRAARHLIREILDYIQVIPVTQTMLKHAMKADFKDFEDAVQHECALTIQNLECIVTRNLRDYKKSRIRAISPEQLF